MVKLKERKIKDNQIENLGFLAGDEDYSDDDGKGAAIAASKTAHSQKPIAHSPKPKTNGQKPQQSGRPQQQRPQQQNTQKQKQTLPAAPSRGTPPREGNTDANDDTLYFFALGGLEHVGQNMYVYKYKGKYLVVDSGMGFLEGEYEGADTKYPDTKFLDKHKKDVVGIVITHGHEDHTGALKYIWEKFRVPIYCTRFVENFMRKTFHGVGIDTKPNDFVVYNHLGDKFSVGPFDIETFHVSHSVPEANMLIITTAQGKVLHTGDWTFNDDNPIEPMTDYARLREIGSDPDLLAVVGDSTEIARQPVQVTEVEVRESLTQIFKNAPGRVLITGYSRSIARLKMVAQAARAAGREPAIKERTSSKPVPYVGLPEFREIGIEYGYLDRDDLALHKDIKDLPAEKQVIFLTGSQGEKYAMLTRLCKNDVKELQLQPTDTVIFSAIVIPGREKDVSFLYNSLAKKGVRYHTIFDTPKIHANGHAGRPEYERFFDMVHPQIIIPMHGEYVSEMLHAKMAMERGGAKYMMLVKNGEVVAMRRGAAPYVAETVFTGSIILEGETEYTHNDPVFKARKNVMLHGAVFVTLPVDKKGFLKGAPEVSSTGIFESDQTGVMKKAVALAITKAIDDLSKHDRRDQKNLENAVRMAVNGALRPLIGPRKKPNITVHYVMK
ncbi:MAG: ribonuclease J [Proteobacteria bacterium]|nr:ribonuclease J [Pseudomonadota bacterium]